MIGFALQSRPNRAVAIMAAICVLGWMLAAINPVDRQAWFLENILVVGFAILLAAFRQQLQLSTLAYLCLGIFLLLHIIGAHYTYQQMPLGFWAQEQFGLTRNHYDRVAHFAFGFCFAVPLWELLMRFSGMRTVWAAAAAGVVILATSGIFEILEAIIAEMVAPGQGVVWLGGQGDEWDAQNDMLAALLGAGAMLGGIALSKRRQRSG